MEQKQEGRDECVVSVVSRDRIDEACWQRI